MKIRYIIEVRTSYPCEEPECVSGRKHSVHEYAYTLPDGTPTTRQPGDVYYSVHVLDAYPCAWDNCDGKHLYCMCPDKDWPEGHPWCIDGRASNCTMKEDRLHRCWVRHGDPAIPGQLHVDKNGHTCKAGAGSIAIAGFHGFLHNGELK